MDICETTLDCRLPPPGCPRPSSEGSSTYMDAVDAAMFGEFDTDANFSEDRDIS